MENIKLDRIEDALEDFRQMLNEKLLCFMACS